MKRNTGPPWTTSPSFEFGDFLRSELHGLGTPLALHAWKLQVLRCICGPIRSLWASKTACRMIYWYTGHTCILGHLLKVCFPMHFFPNIHRFSTHSSWVKQTTHPLQARCLWRNWFTFLRNRMGRRADRLVSFQRLHVQPRSRCPVRGRHAVGWA